MDVKTNQITEKDLNLQDAISSKGNVVAKEGVPSGTPVGDKYLGLKGALAGYAGSFKPQTEYLYIEALRTQLYEFLSELYTWKNLPKGLNKYRLERKLIENGIVYIVKEGDSYFACAASITDWNMYKEPVSIIINEPKSSLNGRKYKQSDNWVFIRNNLLQNSKLQAAFRYLSNLEKILFQLEKNLLASAPKGLIDTRLGTIEFGEPLQPTMKNSMELIINGQDTFYELKVPENVLSQGRGAGLTTGDNKSVFIPIELTDRTDNLMKNYVFQKEQLKELIGADQNNVLGKKERLITTEVDSQQEISDATETHGNNIREIDIEMLNETFSLNVSIELAADEQEEALPLMPPEEKK